MERLVDQKSNKLIYPIQNLIRKFVHLIIIIAIPLFSSKKYKEKLISIENNITLQNILGLTIFNALGGLLLMFTNVKIANVLGASLYGLYSYYLAIGEVGSNFVRYGRHKTMTRDLIQNNNKFENLISNTFILSIINLILFCIVIGFLSDPLDVPLNVAPWLLIVGASIGCIDFQPVYESLRMMSWHAIYYLIQKTIFFLGIWIAILFFSKFSLTYLSIIFFSSWILIVIIQYWEIIVQFGIQIKDYVSWRSIKKLYKSNFLIALSCMTGVAFGPIIQLVLKNHVDSEAVGIYAAGMQIFIMCQFLLNQIARVGNPMMAEAGKNTCSIKERKHFVIRYTTIMILTSLPFLIPLTIFPHSITKLLYASEYSRLGNLLPIYGIYLICFGIGVVFTQFLISLRQDKTYFTIYVISAIATIVCAVTLIPSLGLLGAVISLCIPHSLGCLLYVLFSLKYLK